MWTMRTHHHQGKKNLRHQQSAVKMNWGGGVRKRFLTEMKKNKTEIGERAADAIPQ
jgi:hypothetical protein